jgi:pimeloyl-ACP methyl ester carboxylesterase
MHTSQPKLVLVNGVELSVQTFGDPESPAILLIGGAASSMDWWEDEFCERLASGPRFLIRYDLRDAGQSVGYEPGAPQYAGPDLVADAVAAVTSGPSV